MTIVIGAGGGGITDPGGTVVRKIELDALARPVLADETDATTAPTTLASSPTNRSVVLTWADTMGGRAGFEIQRGSSGAFVSPTTLAAAAGVQTFTDTGLLPATTYYYRMRAVGPAGTSAWTSTVQRTTGAKTYRDVVMDDVPFMYLRMDELSPAKRLRDQCGNIDGHVVGTPAYQDTGWPTDGNKAIHFAAAPHVSLGLLPSLPVFSIEFAARTIVAAQDHKRIFGSEGPVFDIAAHADHIYYYTAASSWVDTGATFTSTLAHFVFTYDGTNLKLYKDGALVYTSGTLAAMLTGGSRIFLAADGSGASKVDATLDEFAMYGKALSPARITTHFNAR